LRITTAAVAAHISQTINGPRDWIIQQSRQLEGRPTGGAAGRESQGCQHRKRDNIGQKNYSREVSGKISNLRPNSWTYNFVEFLGIILKVLRLEVSYGLFKPLGRVHGFLFKPLGRGHGFLSIRFSSCTVTELWKLYEVAWAGRNINNLKAKL
jgi:hypothetical protein